MELINELPHRTLRFRFGRWGEGRGREITPTLRRVAVGNCIKCTFNGNCANCLAVKSFCSTEHVKKQLWSSLLLSHPAHLEEVHLTTMQKEQLLLMCVHSGNYLTILPSCFTLVEGDHHHLVAPILKCIDDFKKCCTPMFSILLSGMSIQLSIDLPFFHQKLTVISPPT